MTCVRRQSVRHGVARSARRRGFTLIEVLMAAFVMAIGVLGLTALFAGAARQQQMSSQSTRSVAQARSADAYLGKRFGPIESMNGGPLKPPVKNNQEPEGTIQADQWYAVPRSRDDGAISLNPTEATTGWRSDSIYTRAEPHEVLPKLLFRTRMERKAGELVATGLPGGDRFKKIGVGQLDDETIGAPRFDADIRELRAIADSFKIRVVTRAYRCGGGTNTDERSLTGPDDKTIELVWNKTVVAGKEGELMMTDGNESEMMVVSDPDAKDSDLGTSNGQTKITYAYIADVVKNLPSDPGCGAATDYYVEQKAGTPSECDLDEAAVYLWDALPAGSGDIEAAPGDGGFPGYDIRQGDADGQRYFYAVLRKVDRCNPGLPLYRKTAVAATGAYVQSNDGVNPPANGTGSPIKVRLARFPTRFIQEIWLDDYQYRAHTLASLPETVTYTQSPENPGLRVPQLGYSMLFRRTADANVQYALFSYAISPTYPPTADKADTTEDDFFPKEDESAITDEQAPLRLAENLDIEFDEDLGLFYVKLAGGDINTYSWLMTPGQVLLFNGDSSKNPPVPGADSPVRVVNVRKINAGEIRGYLDSAPRAGLRALPDFSGDHTFDAWVIAPKCDVTQRSAGKAKNYWGLKPIEARIFTVAP